MGFKLVLMAITWLLALIFSMGLRIWGVQHPEPFLIRPVLVMALLFLPSLSLGAWVLLFGFRQTQLEN